MVTRRAFTAALSLTGLAGNGEMMVGERPFEEFDKKIKVLLKS